VSLLFTAVLSALLLGCDDAKPVAEPTPAPAPVAAPVAAPAEAGELSIPADFPAPPSPVGTLVQSLRDGEPGGGVVTVAYMLSEDEASPLPFYRGWMKEKGYTVTEERSTTDGVETVVMTADEISWFVAYAESGDSRALKILWIDDASGNMGAP
jgi:hypothetical protein